MLVVCNLMRRDTHVWTQSKHRGLAATSGQQRGEAIAAGHDSPMDNTKSAAVPDALTPSPSLQQRKDQCKRYITKPEHWFWACTYYQFCFYVPPLPKHITEPKPERDVQLQSSAQGGFSSRRFNKQTSGVPSGHRRHIALQSDTASRMVSGPMDHKGQRLLSVSTDGPPRIQPDGERAHTRLPSGTCQTRSQDRGVNDHPIRSTSHLPGYSSLA